jgi:hypothetical protein
LVSASRWIVGGPSLLPRFQNYSFPVLVFIQRNMSGKEARYASLLAQIPRLVCTFAMGWSEFILPDLQFWDNHKKVRLLNILTISKFKLNFSSDLQL